jgi:hypothetical protein
MQMLPALKEDSIDEWICLPSSKAFELSQFFFPLQKCLGYFTLFDNSNFPGQ